MFIEAEPFYGIIRGAIRAWERRRASRVVIYLAAAAIVIGILFLVAEDNKLVPQGIGKFVGIAFILPAGVSILLLGLYENTRQESEKLQLIRRAEERVRESPEKPVAAWELASLKLENYINRNLSQVQWIFLLILIIMAGGFAIIGAGVWKAYQDTQNLAPSVVAAGSGILVQFIGATFLVVYRSTIAQARDYVTILERINAVGMSLQILENISADKHEMRDQARVELAKSVLQIYESAAPSGSGSIKATRRTRRSG